MVKEVVLSQSQEEQLEEEVMEGLDYFRSLTEPTYDISLAVEPAVEKMFREWNLRLAVYGL